MNEKEAFFFKAENFREAGKNLPAVEYYEKYLQLEPDQMDVFGKMAGCLISEAITLRDDSLFKRANSALLRGLEKDWVWEKGHQLRVDLFLRFGKLEILANEYEKMKSDDESRNEICQNVIKTIRLTQRFKENPPAISTTLTQDSNTGMFLKNYWAFFFLPLLLWGIFEVATLFNTKDEKHSFLMLFVFLVLGLLVLVMFFVTMSFYKKNNEMKKRKKSEESN